MASEGRTMFGGDEGFTLVEVMVAAVIFAVGVAGATMAISDATRQRLDGERRIAATRLAQRVANNLVSRESADGCTGTLPDGLLLDLRQQAPRSRELLCAGADVNCQPDYPRPGRDDLRRALGLEDETNPGSCSLTTDSFVHGLDCDTGEVLVGHDRFRIVWNVICNMPVQGALRGQVLVLWPPFDASSIAEGRFVAVPFGKTGGL